MLLEELNTAAALGTFVVITATAIAAAVQLRHLRLSNNLNAIIALREERTRPAMDAAFKFVVEELGEQLLRAEFRIELESAHTPSRAVHKELTLADYYEKLGLYVRKGLIEEDLYFQIGNPSRYWKLLEPAIAIYRRRRGRQAFDNFEWLVLREREWDRRHRGGAFRGNERRLDIVDKYIRLDHPEDDGTSK